MEGGPTWLSSHLREGQEILVEVGNRVRERGVDSGGFKWMRGNARQTREKAGWTTGNAGWMGEHGNRHENRPTRQGEPGRMGES